MGGRKDGEFFEFGLRKMKKREEGAENFKEKMEFVSEEWQEKD